MPTTDAFPRIADQVQPGDVLIDGRRVVARDSPSDSEVVLHFGGHPPERFEKNETLYLRS